MFEVDAGRRGGFCGRGPLGRPVSQEGFFEERSRSAVAVVGDRVLRLVEFSSVGPALDGVAGELDADPVGFIYDFLLHGGMRSKQMSIGKRASGSPFRDVFTQLSGWQSR